MHRQIRKHLAVDRKTCLVQTVDEGAVGHAAEARRRIDARDPQCAVLALFLAPAAIGILAGLDDRLLGRAEYLAAGIEGALRFLENFLVPPTGDDTAFYSCHGLSPDSLGVGQTLLDALDVRFADVHLAAQLALTLARLFRQDMTTVGLTALEAIRCFAKTLRRSPLSFQLGHDRLLILWPCSQAPSPRGSPLQAGRQTFFKSAAPLFLGPNTMTICLPSISGVCSTTEYGARSSEIRVSSRRPMS